MSAAATVVVSSAEGAGDMPTSNPIAGGDSPEEGAQPFSEVLSLSSPDHPDSSGSPRRLSRRQPPTRYTTRAIPLRRPPLSCLQRVRRAGHGRGRSGGLVLRKRMIGTSRAPSGRRRPRGARRLFGASLPAPRQDRRKALPPTRTRVSVRLARSPHPRRPPRRVCCCCRPRRWHQRLWQQRLPTGLRHRRPEPGLQAVTTCCRRSPLRRRAVPIHRLSRARRHTFRTPSAPARSGTARLPPA